MRSVIYLVIFLLPANSIAQDFLLTDSTMRKALLPEGFKNTGVTFKSFAAKSTNGERYTADSLMGKVTFISFWFAECAPCLAEFDALNDLYDRYKKNEKFQFLSFTFETSEKASTVANKYHISYPILCVPKPVMYDLIFDLGFPTNIVTDRQGKIILIKCGGGLTKEMTKANIETLFSKQVEDLLSSK